MSKILISITGPTAIGKTRLSILLAKHLVTEIISADSRQFFKEMAIGTAVPTKKELNAVQHHFVQHKSVLEPYSVGDFERDAVLKLEELFKTRSYVIMVGGSGLYSDAVTTGLDKFPEVDLTIREELNEELDKKGINVLQKQLKQLDADYFQKVDIHNPHRIIRALEICIGTGKPYSTFLNKKKPTRNFKILNIGLQAERSLIYEKINKRVDIMISEGLLEEAKKLVPLQHLNALKTVGYKELFEYFSGNWELDFAIAEIKKNTRRFAKRQMTWFKRNENTLWLDYNYEQQNALRIIDEHLLNIKNE